MRSDARQKVLHARDRPQNAPILTNRRANTFPLNTGLQRSTASWELSAELLQTGSSSPMPYTCFERQIVRLRLPSFMFARYGRISLGRQPHIPDDNSWHDVLAANGLARFTWSTFNDERMPRAIGMRITSLLGHGHVFEVAEWYTPQRIV